MQTRTVSILSLTLAMAVFFWVGPLVAQPSEAPRSHKTPNEVYAPSVTPAIYLINFLFLYMANPDLAAYCRHIERPFLNRSSIVWSKIQGAAPMLIITNPSRIPTVALIKTGSASGRRFARRCEMGAPGAAQIQTGCRHQRAIGEGASGSIRSSPRHGRRHDPDAGETSVLIGIPPRDHDREIIFRCIYNLTNSTGNAAIPLSSYGLNVNEQRDIRSVCAPDAPCLEFNSLFGGRLEVIAAECGFLDKLLRVETETPLLQFVQDGNPCQESGEPACLEATCAGNGP